MTLATVRHFLFLTLIVAAGALSAPAPAHQQKAAITKVLFNARTGNIEVMHRFYLHDAEHAVREIFSKEADIIGSSDTQRAFADYVMNRFELIAGEGDSLPLSYVGLELERRFIWVYQETPARDDLAALTIRHNALRDLWPQQINTVNIEGLEEIRTATFEGSVELLTVTVKD